MVTVVMQPLKNPVIFDSRHRTTCQCLCSFKSSNYDKRDRLLHNARPERQLYVQSYIQRYKYDAFEHCLVFVEKMLYNA